MRVMRPDHHLHGGTFPAQNLDQPVQRLGHVSVADVPRRRLGIFHQSRILLSGEIIVFRHLAVAQRVLGGGAARVDELSDDLILARLAEPEPGGVTVGKPRPISPQ